MSVSGTALAAYISGGCGVKGLNRLVEIIQVTHVSTSDLMVLN